MKVSYQQLWDSQMSLPRLTGTQFPAKTAYRLSKNAAHIEREIKTLDEARKELVMKYGKADDKGNFNVLKENETQFMTEMNVWLEMMVDIDIMQIDIKDLGDVKLSAREFSSISFMIKEDV
jgi:hypothetical protein